MLNHLKSEANIAYTENGAVTNASTMSDCLDLFAVIGALRAADDQEIIRRFVRAYAEDADIAMKILFFGRDVRGGLGERRVFALSSIGLPRTERSPCARTLSLSLSSDATTIWYLSSARPAKRMLCVLFASSWRPTLRLTQRCPCWRNGFRL